MARFQTLCQQILDALREQFQKGEMMTGKHPSDLSDWAENLTGGDLANATVHAGEEEAARGRAMLEAALGGAEPLERALGGPSLPQ